MTRAVFTQQNGDYTSFTITGHTGFSESGTDIVCSAVSSMTELVINTISEKYGAGVDIKIDPRDATISAAIYRIADDKAAYAIRGLMEGFLEHLKALEQEYPDNISVVLVEG